MSISSSSQTPASGNGEVLTHHSLSECDKAIIQEELEILRNVTNSIAKQLKAAATRHYAEQERSRELTSELVAAHREEDKAMLASDEAVAHAMTERAYESHQTLDQLQKKPYFARFVVIEEDERGNERRMEYRLGFHSNPDCRIVDWRKGPISKLYYEYREGDFYDEEIQGRSRSGEVLLRRSFDIQHGVLQRITTPNSSFTLRDGVWHRDEAGEALRAGRMRNVQALITPEQFRLITEEARTAVLLQGIAGSGKTTVALHRLAWLLHDDNSQVTPEQCLILVLSPSLGAYVKNALEHLELPAVPVLPYADWKFRRLRSILTLKADEALPLASPSDTPPQALRRYKQSLSCLNALKEFCRERRGSNTFRGNPLSFLEEFYFSEPLLQNHLEEDEFLRNFDLSIPLARYRHCKSQGVLDHDDTTLLIVAENELTASREKLSHIVVDEVQDYGVVELAAAIGSARSTADATIVGDASQSLNPELSFPGWSKLQRSLGLNSDSSQYVSLTISHRSTLPIMQLADAIQARSLVTEGREGRVPIWFQCLSERSALTALFDWLSKAQRMYPDELTAVICNDGAEAKEVAGLLKQRFGESLRLGTAANFQFDAGIMVTELALTRGLEFFNVLVWNVSRDHYPNDSGGRNKLYIASTRAEENLALISHRSSSALLEQCAARLRHIAEKPPEE